MRTDRRGFLGALLAAPLAATGLARRPLVPTTSIAYMVACPNMLTANVWSVSGSVMTEALWQQAILLRREIVEQEAIPPQILLNRSAILDARIGR